MPKGCFGVICGIESLAAGNSGGNILLVLLFDFICAENNLIIEVVGGPHAENEEQDIQHSEYLNRMGYRIFRFWNNQVMQEKEGVLEAILAILANTDQNSPSPQPSHTLEGEREKL